MSEPTPVPSATVLVVDDEPAVRYLTQRFLTVAGYRAFAAVDGADALSVLDHVTGPVDLVLTDVVMPRLDGVELIQEVLERWPQQRVLLMSAHSVEVLAQHRVVDLQKPFLAKPFGHDELVAKVEAVLQQMPPLAG